MWPMVKNCHFIPEDANISSMGAHSLLKHLDLIVRIYLVVFRKYMNKGRRKCTCFS